MDEQLLNEDMKKMQPYLLKWHKEYSVMLLTSKFKTLQYEIAMEGLAPVKEMLCQGYLYSISEAFRELVKTHYYAQAAYKIEAELRGEGDIGWSNYWKFEVKNYYFRTVIPRIISLLDYVAVMINELSQRELVSNVRRVDYRTIMLALESRVEKAGWLSYEEIIEVAGILSIAYANTIQEDIRLLKDYRDIATHRYFVGIDELTVSFQRRELSKNEQQMYGTQQTYSYGMHGRPEYSFNELNITAEKLLNNLDVMLSKLMQMDIMQGSVKLREE